MIPEKEPDELTDLKQEAIRLGATDSTVIFSGGSCKQLFCEENTTCSVLSDKLPCSLMIEARPSMSGFGIDVIQLMNTSGWPVVKTKQNKGGPENLSWVAGLVLQARFH